MTIPRIRNRIAGEEVDAIGGAVVVDRDPADARTPIAEAPASERRDVARAVAAAAGALAAWKATPAPRRGQALSMVAARLLADHELPQILTRDQGKTLDEARSEIRRAAEAFEFCAGETRRLAGETLPSEAPGRLVLTLREPVGVVGLITPSNYPALIAAWKIAPALATGNTTVWCPSPHTPLISSRIATIVDEALLSLAAPPGVLNVVHGAGPVVGAAVAEHPDVTAVSFTGSTLVGSELQRTLAERGAPALCEMGGKNPLVVLDDADVDFAAQACVRGAFANAGQRCTSTSRVILLPSVAQAFQEALVERARRLSLGPGLSPSSDMGPLVSEPLLHGVEQMVSRAVAGGAKALLGGERATHGALEHGWFYPPTILAGVPAYDPIAQEEVFGPVLVILHAKDDADALAMANGVRYGLSASVYTRDLDRAMRFVKGIDAGIVHVNSPTVGGETHVSFGGLKATSNGGRERGRAAVDFFTRWKTVFLDTAP